MTEEQMKVQKTQLTLMKIQTGLIAGVLVLLFAVGMFVVGQINTLMNTIDLNRVNATVASLQTTAEKLEEIDVKTIEGAIDSLKGAAENLSQTDIEAINEGIRSLSTAANNLNGLDVDEMNELIKSLETVAAQMEKTTSVFAKVFGR